MKFDRIIKGEELYFQPCDYFLNIMVGKKKKKTTKEL